MQYTFTIPSNLPQDAPLLWGFMSVILAEKIPVYLSWDSNELLGNNLPAFTFTISETTYFNEEGKEVFELSEWTCRKDKITAVIWDKKSTHTKGSILWKYLPNALQGLAGRTVDASAKLPLEQWKKQMNDYLYLIVKRLTEKNPKNNFGYAPQFRGEWIGDILGIELIEDLKIQYARGNGAQQVHGMAATFSIQRPQKNCCLSPQNIGELRQLLTKQGQINAGFLILQP